MAPWIIPTLLVCHRSFRPSRVAYPNSGLPVDNHAGMAHAALQLLVPVARALQRAACAVPSLQRAAAAILCAWLRNCHVHMAQAVLKDVDDLFKLRAILWIW